MVSDGWDFGMRSVLSSPEPRQELGALSVQFGSDKLRYCSIYETYFHESRDAPLNFLEIGIGGYDDPKAGGASLRMWEAYFKNAQISALDLYDKQAHAAERVKVYQGSQDDEALLLQIVNDMGRLDVVLDDGSHFSHHVIKSFQTLFPLLAPGGLYLIEDIGTSYWPEYGGNEDIDSPETSMAYFKRLADGLNHDTIRGGFIPTEIDRTLSYVHFHPNLVVVGKL